MKTFYTILGLMVIAWLCFYCNAVRSDEIQMPVTAEIVRCVGDKERACQVDARCCQFIEPAGEEQK